MKIEAPSKADLQQCFGDLGTNVGPRTGSAARTKEQKELWCLRRYIFTLAAADRIDFPVVIEKSESPDFRCAFGSRTLGIEVTEATDPRDQREMTIIEQEDVPTLRGSHGGRFPRGASGNAPEREWEADVLRAVASKAQKIRSWSHTLQAYSLLLYTNSNAGSLIFNWQRAFSDFEAGNECLWKEILSGLPVDSVAVICDQWLLMLKLDSVLFYRLRSGTDDDISEAED